MANLKNFFNKILNSDKIYTAEDIGKMTSKEFARNEKAIDFQMENLGIPRENDLVGNSDVIYVHSYTKDDGTEVRAHYRSKPDGIRDENYQTNSITGGAADINQTNIRYSEIKNIDSTLMKPTDFSELENRNGLSNINANLNVNRPDARELMNISLSGFKNLPEHSEFSVFQPKAVEFVNNTLNIKNSKGLVIPDNWYGVIYDKNSGFAKRLSNSQELQSQVMAKYDQTKKTFTTDQILLDFKQDKNLNYSIGHGTILNPKIKDDGTFTGVLFDKYDYDLHIKEYISNPKITAVNNFMYGVQYTKSAANYYVIIPVSFNIRK